MTTTDILSEVTRRIVEGLHPSRVILFGSRARGDARWDSDYDVLIVMPDGTDRRATALSVRRALADLPIGKDIIVTTPDEIARRGRMVGTVLKPALEEGVTLYERG